MTVLYSNNAASTLAATITNSTTSMSVASGHGIKFPAPSGGDYFFMTLVDTGGTIEIVKVTARTNDTMTIERGQDGTTASAFSAGSKVELRITKAMLDQLKLDAGLLGFTNVFYDQLNGSAAVGGEVALGSGATISANGAIAIGPKASASAGAEYSLVVGNQAASIAPFATALGFGARVEAETGIAIGFNSLVNSGANNAIAIGYNTGVASNATNSIVLGATSLATQPNAVVLNASDGTIYSLSAGFFVKPIRDSSNNQTVTGVLKYDATTGEVFYAAGGGLVGITDFYDGSTHFGSTSLGVDTYASNQGVAIGNGTSVDGEGAIGIGSSNLVFGVNVIAIGRNVVATNDHGICIGYQTQASENGVSLGQQAYSGHHGVAIGYQAQTEINGIAIGEGAIAAGNSVVLNATGSALTAITDGLFAKPIRDNTFSQTSSGALQYDSNTGEVFYGGGLTGTTTELIVDFVNYTTSGGLTSLGVGANAQGKQAVAIGAMAGAYNNSTAVGCRASVNTEFSTAIGAAVSVSGAYSTAIGYGLNVGENYHVIIGTNIQATGAPNVIAINATADQLAPTFTSGFYVKPIRANGSGQTSAGFLQYDSTTGEVFYGPAYAYYNSNTTNALDYTNGSVQRWAPSTGAQTLSITNWPPSGNLGELMIEGVNLGAATITWPAAIKWVKSDGSTTTTFSSSGVTLQTSGTDFVVLWTRDAGTTIYGKVVR